MNSAERSQTQPLASIGARQIAFETQHNALYGLRCGKYVHCRNSDRLILRYNTCGVGFYRSRDFISQTLGRNYIQI
nr:hypothetical protein [Leptospira interrogans]